MGTHLSSEGTFDTPAMILRGEYSQTTSLREIGILQEIPRGDPHIAEQIDRALGDAESVVNVSAGLGTYEPLDREVIPVESSELTIALRSPRLAPAIEGYAENLPLASNSVDAGLACLKLHKWSDWRIALQELRRVARRRVVILTYDASMTDRFWLLRDYLPKLARLEKLCFPRIGEQSAAVGEEVAIEPVPIAHDCPDDSLLGAYWRRPHAYLQGTVRAGIPTFRQPGAELELEGLDRLSQDLRSGDWEERNRLILDRQELDLGYRLLVTEL